MRYPPIHFDEGKPVSAGALNRLASIASEAHAQIARLELLINSRQGFARAPVSIIRCVIVDGEQFPDTILCSIVDGLPGHIHVAKPYLLRRTPWENDQERNGFRYDYVSNVERDSIKVADANDKERQVITPSYAENDILYAQTRALTGKDDLWTTPEMQSRIVTSWVDLNIDGRCWAKGSAS